MSEDREFGFWGVKAEGFASERELLGILKAKTLDDALAMFEMLLRSDAWTRKMFRRIDISFCVRDFEKGGRHD